MKYNSTLYPYRSIPFFVGLMSLFFICTIYAAPTTASADFFDNLSVTHHSVQISGRRVDYTATAGYLPYTDDSGNQKADIFFVAYTRDPISKPLERPIAFAFNGGPGAAAIWLHFGALGPRRIPFPDNGTSMQPLPHLVNNDYTWLDFTDLVFIDPVGSGFSRAAKGIDEKQFYKVEGDVHSIGAFIRLYLTHNRRWLSPKYIVGESYGTTRAAGLADYLQDSLGIYPAGLVMVSSVLDFQTILFESGNDLPYALILPTYTAVAAYHKKLNLELVQDLPQTLDRVEQWCLTDYLSLLARGDAISKREQIHATGQIAEFAGLAKNVVAQSHLRVGAWRFLKELLRDRNRIVGLMDGRYVGIDLNPFGEYGRYDPSFFMTIGPLNTVANDYIRNELNFKSGLPYEYLSRKANETWDYSEDRQGYLNVGSDLKQAMTKNSRLRVFFACGIYDLTTPYFATVYTISHLYLDPVLMKNIILIKYPSGHQLYTDMPTLIKFKSDAQAFFNHQEP